jgi:hypothetical protein
MVSDGHNLLQTEAKLHFVGQRLCLQIFGIKTRDIGEMVLGKLFILSIEIDTNNWP